MADGTKVWMEGNEQVTETSYFDKNDLDEDGRPKLKRMRVRKVASGSTVSSRSKLGRKRGPRRPSDEEYDADEQNLRDMPLTEEEQERLRAFQENISVQCELEFVEGSLDLGEVFRKSFRIYSTGASIDIDPNYRPPMRTVNMNTAAADLELPPTMSHVGITANLGGDPTNADLEAEERQKTPPSPGPSKPK